MNVPLLGLSLAALAIALPTLLTASSGTPRSQEGAAAVSTVTAPQGVEWRTDLAAAMEEARRTSRPLLAVFR
ncbi:MAG: ABC-type sugar transport system substrate-binding protein [Planctomycetota bacterium]|jgi:ABC-type sugar transport system substrate-binding protein